MTDAAREIEEVKLKPGWLAKEIREARRDMQHWSDGVAKSRVKEVLGDG